MSADSIEPAEDFLGFGDGRFAITSVNQNRDFWTALAFVILVHTGILLGVIHHTPRMLGEPGAREDAIAVSFMTEAEFLEQTSAPPTAGNTPAAPAKPAPPPPPNLGLKPTEPMTEQPDTGPLPNEKDAPDLFALEAPDAAPKEPAAVQKKPQQKSQPKKTANLDLTPQVDSTARPSNAGGGPAGFVRPSGITRSGANDNFGRGVIKALRQTMPGHRGVFGRVTVRILLTPNGDVKDVQLVSGAADPTIAQEVIFAARQTTYPIPPAGATPADLQFLISYTYN